jgi:hypothetical protein
MKHGVVYGPENLNIIKEAKLRTVLAMYVGYPDPASGEENERFVFWWS